MSSKKRGRNGAIQLFRIFVSAICRQRQFQITAQYSEAQTNGETNMNAPQSPRSRQESQPMLVSRPLSPSMVDDLPLMSQISIGSGTSDMTSHPAVSILPENKKTTHSSRRRKSTARPSSESVVSSATVFQSGVRLLDRYEVLRKIGQGGMSAVYEAYDEARDENVALKVLLPELARHQRMQERFLQEGRLSSSFSHPNIARVYDLHQSESVAMISMELLHGCNLRHDMERRAGQRQKYRPLEVLHVIEQASNALSVVHAASVIHRDLKPENLWSCLDESIKIMDFGIARESTGNVFTTGPRGSGTPYYIAPEQLNASPLLDHRADQYSLAVIAYEMLTGVIPQGAIVPPHHKVQGIPKKLSMAVYRALNADPNKRFSDIRAFAEASRFRIGMSPWVRAAMLFGGLSLVSGAAAGYQLKIAPMLNVKPSPVWATIAPVTIVEKNEITIDTRATDSTLQNDQLTFRLLSDAPEGATIDAATGRVKWTPNEAQGPKDYSFQVMAIVQQPGFPQRLEERTVKVAVTEAFDPPVFESPETAEAKEHAPFEMQLQARDTNTPAIDLKYELTSGPLDMEIDSRTGKITWTPGEKHGGSVVDLAVKVSLSQETQRNVAVERKFKVKIEESIDPPTFISANQLRGEVGKATDFRVITRDTNDPPLNIYYKLRGGDRAGFSIDPNTGELSWTPEQDLSGKEFDLAVEALYDFNGQSKRVGEQTIKVAVEKFNPPKEDKDDNKKGEGNASTPTNSAPSVDSLPPAPQCSPVPSPGGVPATCPSTTGQGGGIVLSFPNNPGNGNGQGGSHGNGNGQGNGHGTGGGTSNGGGQTCPSNPGNGNGGVNQKPPVVQVPNIQLPNGTVLTIPPGLNDKLRKVQPNLPFGTPNSLPLPRVNPSNSSPTTKPTSTINSSGSNNRGAQNNQPASNRQKIEKSVGNLLKQIQTGR
jgi:tRNA A-37 threonylcarbamoyl transferase component Bud32